MTCPLIVFMFCHTIKLLNLNLKTLDCKVFPTERKEKGRKEQYGNSRQ